MNPEAPVHPYGPSACSAQKNNAWILNPTSQEICDNYWQLLQSHFCATSLLPVCDTVQHGGIREIHISHLKQRGRIDGKELERTALKEPGNDARMDGHANGQVQDFLGLLGKADQPGLDKTAIDNEEDLCKGALDGERVTVFVVERSPDIIWLVRGTGSPLLDSYSIRSRHSFANQRHHRFEDRHAAFDDAYWLTASNMQKGSSNILLRLRQD
ncbi:hypothetical protein EV363DRAFT_1296776 [Boletus edulis]|nr:hypothetical protein EV363DRAFT_1296776 [Boletus edulis]